MKTQFGKGIRLLCAVILLYLSACNESGREEEYGEATLELIDLVETNPEVKSMLLASIEKASKINPDPRTNPSQDLESYYEFVSWAERAMPWQLLRKESYSEIFDNTFQGLGAFYFVIDQPLPELEGRDLVNNSIEYTEPFASWLVKFNKSWGSFLDTEESWNEAYYQLAYNDPAFGLQHDWYEDPSNWSTYNEFFARYLRSPGVRPIASPEADSVVVSYADSSPQGVWAIDSLSRLVADRGIAIKSATLRSVANLIGEESEYSDAFANGTFTHSFLNTNDYHRYHFPMSGTVREVRIVQGRNPTGGRLWWDTENNRYAFDPNARTGWQTVETRGCVILETKNHGLVALLPIGMAVVGSVKFEEDVRPGLHARKGDMLGNFAFGGSDFIMIFQEGVEFTLEAPQSESGGGYQHLLMGEHLGTLKIKRQEE